MRRKSERNKGKSSPEKKVEKPTRKSTRRRTKKSPSTTPERDNTTENDKLKNDSNESGINLKIQTRLHSKDTSETIIEEPESKVTSTEQIVDDIIDDSGSVWKVARADASPGEIQKLKLCRQRNLSETSDVSLSRKRITKNNDGGSGSCGGSGGNDSVVEEADSADEKPPTSNDKFNVDNFGLADDTSSTTIGGRDSGEEVSDSKEIPPETTTTVDLSDVKPNIDQQQQEQQEPEATVQGERIDVDDNCDANTNKIETAEEAANVIDDTGTGIMKEAPEPTEDKKSDDKGDLIDKIDDNVNDAGTSKTNESVDDELAKNQSSEDEEKSKITRNTGEFNSSVSSNDEGNDKNLRSTRSSRRKHRDKYRDSSNSDTGESEDDNDRCIDKEKNISKSEGVSMQDDGAVTENNEISKDDGVINVKESAKDGKLMEIAENDKDGLSGGDTQINLCRPAKVNLKRSFTSRISTDESKRDDTESTNDVNQDKENHVTEDSKTIPKRRRWGTALSTDIAPVLSISTDSLKALVPGAKPLSMNEVRLAKDEEDDRDRRREKRYTVNESEKVKEDVEAKNESSKDNHIVARRKISIVKDTPQLISPSPPVAQPTNILLIKNLVRPFTLNQIKELLSRTGTIVENGFWMDRIKSKCFVEYSNEDQAFETRQALHGISWPMSNPKKLQVEYSTREEMDKMKESSKDQPLSRKLEALPGGDPWQQDWGRDEKSNSTAKVTVVREWDLGKEDGQHPLKDKDKDKKDMDKKRRQRSRSPTLEAHLPAPARKFKKKEDEPPPAKLLDDLFRKTKATPSIYWLPLTNEQIVVKEEMRRQHMAEHARRLEEMRRAERNRDNRRRRSPRK